MVEQFYVAQVTRLSRRELQRVFQAAEPPVALLGGWAVHLHVNPEFRSTHGREYIGSRDIDLGVHIQPDWTPEEVRAGAAARTIELIEGLGYRRSRFGLVRNFDRDTGEPISEDEASDQPLHDVFQVSIDVIPDTTDLDNFEAAFGFRPPAEPLLQPVFEEDFGEPLTRYVDWDAPDTAAIASPDLLAAMKVRSLPDRDESHKKVKDIADLHALLWYVTDYDQMAEQVLEHMTGEDLESLDQALNSALFRNAASLLETDEELVEDTIIRLLR